LEQYVLTSPFVTTWDKSTALRPYKECLRRNSTNVKNDSYPKAVVDKCLPLAINKCKEATIRVAKVIRFGAYMLEQILQMDRSINIVHYVRDPRGLIVSTSAMRHWTITSNSTTQWSTTQCYRMHQDKIHTDKLARTVNILELRYEDLATQFIPLIQKIYSSINRITPRNVIKWFNENTNSEKKADSDIMGTSRANSTDTAFKWRELLPIESKNIVDEICKDVLTDYGYQL
jgi:keratan sulfate 6-sulfotransferase 1